MTDPGFRIDGVYEGIPFRRRTAFGGYLAFARQEHTVLVEPSAAHRLRRAAEQAWPHETGGLLAGRALRDADGAYVAVSGFVEAMPEAGSPGTFSLSPQETAELREVAFGHHPAADVVGWWHSHLGPSSYSDTDLATQSTWTQQESVGLLVFARGESWGIAYLGPDALRLSPAKRLPGQDPAPPTPALPPAATGTSVPSPSPSISGSGGTRLTPRFWKIAIVSMPLITGMLMAGGVLGGLALYSHQVGAGLRDLSSQVKDIQHSTAGQGSPAGHSQPGGPAVAWSCVRRTAASYSCSVKLRGLTGAVAWVLDGSVVSHDLHPVIPVRNDGRPHVIGVRVTGRTGEYSAGQQTLR
jgi:proteasome lid subunit RPN8/RPN11